MDWFIILKNHWKAVGFVVCIGLAGLGGRLSAPKCQPAVELHQLDDYEGTRNNDIQVVQSTAHVDDHNAQVQVVTSADPVNIKRHIVYVSKTTPGTPGDCPATVTEDDEESRGVVSTTTNVSSQDKSSSQSQSTTTDKSKTQVAEHVVTDLKITPILKLNWAAGVGFDRVFTDRQLRFEVDRRLIGDLWVSASYVPATQNFGVMAKFEF